MSPTRRNPWLVLLSLASLLGCGDTGSDQLPEAAPPSGMAPVGVEAPWQGRRPLVEDLRIGGLNSEPVFGALEDLAVHPDGGVLTFDIQAGQIYRFGSDGSFLGRIGSQGQGPAEYDGVNGIAVSASGEIYVRSMDGRFLVFDSTGEFLRSWRFPTRLMHDRKVTVDDTGHLVVQETLVRPNRPFQIAGRGFIRMLPTGEIVDTLGPIRSPWDDEAVSTHPTHASKHLEWHPAGVAIAGVSSRMGFALIGAGLAERSVELPYTPVEYAEDEYEQWMRHAEWLRTRVASPDYVADPSATKPAYIQILTAPSGQIWIQRAGPSVSPEPGWVDEAFGAPRTPDWLAPLEFLVFDPSGEPLGELVGPLGIRPKAVTDQSVWGYAKGELGEQYIIRLSVRD